MVVLLGVAVVVVALVVVVGQGIALTKATETRIDANRDNGFMSIGLL